MNEFEKRAFEVLGEGEKEKIAGEVKDTDELSTEQCEKLKSTISNLSKEDQLKIAGGKKEKGTCKIKPSKKPIPELLPEKILVAYGGPRPYYDPYKPPLRPDDKPGDTL